MIKHLAWIALFAACGDGSSRTVDALMLGDAVYLAVENVGGHCSVAIGDGQPLTDAEQIIGDYFPGQTVSLTATASAGFALGPWHHTTHAAGSGSADVTFGDEPACVWICCGSTDDCAVVDPCVRP